MQIQRIGGYNRIRDYFEFNGFRPFYPFGSVYYINLDGVILDATFKRAVRKINSEGELVVKINSLDNLRIVEVSVATILSAVSRNTGLSFDIYRYLKVYYLDGNITNTHPSNTLWKPFPETIKIGPLRYLPTATKYGVACNGWIFNLSTGKRIVSALNVNGYYVSKITFDSGNRGFISQHRALMLAWSDYPSNVYELQVNHKNGIKIDNDLDNLEWCTASENMQHAVIMGLQPPPFREQVEVVNIVTKEHLVFDGYRKAADYFNLSVSGIVVRCRSNGNIIFDKWLFRKKALNKPWPLLPKKMKAIRNISSREYSSGKIVSYESIRAAAKIHGITDMTLRFRLETQGKIIFNGYQWKFDDLVTDWPLTPSLAKNEFSVFVQKEDETPVKYDSLSSAAKMVGILSSNLSKALKKNPRYKYKKYLIWKEIV